MANQYEQKPLWLLRSSHAAVGTTIAAMATITDTISRFVA
jgi:hypothetical protein